MVIINVVYIFWAFSAWKLPLTFLFHTRARLWYMSEVFGIWYWWRAGKFSFFSFNSGLVTFELFIIYVHNMLSIIIWMYSCRFYYVFIFSSIFSWRISMKLWSCNFNSQLANALSIEGDYRGSLSALECGYACATEVYYPELQVRCQS